MSDNDDFKETPRQLWGFDLAHKHEQPENEKQGEEVEGYAYCDSHKQKCLNDCGGNGNATPFLSDLN